VVFVRAGDGSQVWASDRTRAFKSQTGSKVKYGRGGRRGTVGVQRRGRSEDLSTEWKLTFLHSRLISHN
jgi:hypothetical protein